MSTRLPFPLHPLFHDVQYLLVPPQFVRAPHSAWNDDGVEFPWFHFRYPDAHTRLVSMLTELCGLFFYFYSHLRIFLHRPDLSVRKMGVLMSIVNEHRYLLTVRAHNNNQIDRSELSRKIKDI